MHSKERSNDFRDKKLPFLLLSFIHLARFERQIFAQTCIRIHIIKYVMFHVADTINHDIVVSASEKLNLRCFQNFDVEATWYKDGEALRRSTTRVRLTKQSLKFKYVELSDAGVYGCRLETKEGVVEWRNVTVHVEPLQNDGFHGEGEDEETRDARTEPVRPEEETNDLEIETKSESRHRRIRIKCDIRRIPFRFFRDTCVL